MSEESPPYPAAQVLRDGRLRTGLTQQELAHRTGISVAAIRDLEQGRSRRPRLSSLRALVEVLGLSDDEVRQLALAPLPPADPAVAAPVPAPSGQLFLGILGQFVVRLGGVAVHLGTGRHRSLLARLALSANTTVSRDEIVELLWGAAVPSGAATLLRNYVSRLRQRLRPSVGDPGPELLTFTAGGYRLTVDPEVVDALRFRQLVSAAADPVDAPYGLDLLDRALDLWRGEPLADLVELHGDPLVTELAQERVAATTRYAELAERLGLFDRALHRLRPLAPHRPLDEPLQARFIAALAATGRQAEALAVYDGVRDRLATELGIDPSPQLVLVRQDVLRRRWARTSAGGSPAPFQAPAPPADFRGRAEQLRRIAELLQPADSGEVPVLPVCVVSGVAGVGKTALVLRAAQVVRSTFPDGQLFVDLQGADADRPVPPLEALSRLLRGLGVEGRRVPVDEKECAALYRSLLADRRLLVILDNARDAAHVRPLLPGAGGCAVLVTSRRRLPDLAASVGLDLPVLSPAEAVEVLASIAGPDRVGAEPDIADELAAACGRLPLALRVAGGRLVAEPRWTLRTLAGRLRDERSRLGELRVGDTGVEPSFHLSYRALSGAAARAFRLLALVPGPDFAAGTAAALLDTGTAAARAALTELTEVNLIQLGEDGRYRYHDLLRLFAGRASEREDAAAVRSTALDRLLRRYLLWMARAARAIHPEMIRLPVEGLIDEPVSGRADGRLSDRGAEPCSDPGAGPIPGRAERAGRREGGGRGADGDGLFDSDREALAWVDVELPGLVAAVRLAGETGRDVLTWQLVDQLRTYFFVRSNAATWLECGRIGLAAAVRTGDRRAQAAMQLSVGQALWAAGQREHALTAYGQAQSAAREGGWLLGSAYLLHNIGLVQVELGRPEDADRSYQEALRVSREHGFRHVQAVTLNDLGALCHERGQLSRAVECFVESLRLNDEPGRRQSAMANRSNLGMVLRELGEFEAARPHLEAALEWSREIGAEAAELAVLDELSQLYAATGKHGAAVDAATRALALTQARADRRAEAAILATLGHALLAGGSVAEADARFGRAGELAAEHGSAYFEIRARIGLALVRLAEGRSEVAIDVARAAATAARVRGYRLHEGDAQLALARAYLALEYGPEAAAIGREALANYELVDARAHVRAAAAVVARAEAVTAAGRGRALANWGRDSALT